VNGIPFDRDRTQPWKEGWINADINLGMILEGKGLKKPSKVRCIVVVVGLQSSRWACVRPVTP
jgi:hypothetical protein